MATFTFLGTHYECPKSKNESIREWLLSVDPDDYQAERIPTAATFANSKRLLSEIYSDLPKWYQSLDTMVRDIIYLGAKHVIID